MRWSNNNSIYKRLRRHEIIKVAKNFIQQKLVVIIITIFLISILTVKNKKIHYL